MKNYYVKKVASSTLAVVLAVTLSQPLFAEELDTEIPSAGATVVIEDYIANNGSDKNIESFLPKEPEKKEVKKDKANSTDNASKEVEKNVREKYFEDIAIAEVSGGAEDYVNVRKKPSTESKIVGKIYNNCGARILETTENGWYKIVSGNCTGYIKAEYFATGSDAEEYALDAGYVFANITGTGIHVREKATTESGIVTNVYHNENYVIKKFNKDGSWIKIKIGDGVSGWISAEFAKVSINMDTAITIEEEKEMIRRQKEEEERQRQAAAAAQAQQNNNSGDGASSGNTNNYTSNTTTTTSSGSSKGAAVVAYAKQFLGNPYVYGGSSLTNGTDCSGFTMSVYAHFGYGLNRTSYTQVYNGTAVSMSNLAAGDLLFYKNGGSTISHVAIYIGGGQIIHASTESTGIIISGIGSPCAARRIIN